MSRALSWNAVVAVCLLAVTSVSARTCVLGTEPDESLGNRVRFVLPPGDPCSCTELMLGGHNTYAAPRKDKPVYIDNLPVDAEGLRRSQGCPDESTQREETSTSHVETTGSPTTREARVVYTDCQDALDKGQNTSGVYAIKPYGDEHFDAYCDMTTNKGYIVIQKRHDGSVNFFRSWNDYKEGFGDLDGEFWFGNEKVHKIAREGCELLITLTAFDGSVAQARYGQFLMKDEAASYEVDAAAFDDKTDAGNAFNSKQFSTVDNDNDDDDMNCAKLLNGGWWFAHCSDTTSNTESNLNGEYHDTAHVGTREGIYWAPWKGSEESLKETEMKIRKSA